jgi:predicted nucleic acid-binding Zn ribbon protein
VVRSLAVVIVVAVAKLVDFGDDGCVVCEVCAARLLVELRAVGDFFK